MSDRCHLSNPVPLGLVRWRLDCSDVSTATHLGLRKSIHKCFPQVSGNRLEITSCTLVIAVDGSTVVIAADRSKVVIAAYRRTVVISADGSTVALVENMAYQHGKVRRKKMMVVLCVAYHNVQCQTF